MSEDATPYAVGADGSIEIVVAPMRGALLVPEAEYEPGI